MIVFAQRLGFVTPTILTQLKIPVPPDMRGKPMG